MLSLYTTYLPGSLVHEKVCKGSACPIRCLHQELLFEEISSFVYLWCICTPCDSMSHAFCCRHL